MSCCGRRSAASSRARSPIRGSGSPPSRGSRRPPDLRHAKVWVSVIGQPKERTESIAALTHAHAVHPARAGRAAAHEAHPDAPCRARRHGRARDADPAAPRRARSRSHPRGGSRHRRVAADARQRACRTRATWPRSRPPAVIPPTPRRAADASRRAPRRQRAAGERLPGAVPGRGPGRAWWTRIRGARRVLAVSHENPDADTLGATLAIVRLVEALGGTADAGLLGRTAAACTPSCRASSGSGPIPTRPRRTTSLVISDCGALSRVGERRRAPRRPVREPAAGHRRPPRVQRRGRGRRLDRARRPRPRARWSRCWPARLGVPLDLDDGALATALMGGIVMDTATFAHPNATARLRSPSRSALVEVGAPLSDISRRDLSLEARCPAAPVRPRPRPSRDGGRRPHHLVDADRRRPVDGDRDRGAGFSEGIIDLLAEAEAAEVALLLKEDPRRGPGSACGRDRAGSTRRC